MDDVDFELHCLDIIEKELAARLRGGWDHGDFQIHELQAMAQALDVDPSPHFVSIDELLQYCGDADLRSIAGDLDLPTKGAMRDSLIHAIAMATWPRVDVPDVLKLPKPSSKGKKR